MIEEMKYAIYASELPLVIMMSLFVSALFTVKRGK